VRASLLLVLAGLGSALAAQPTKRPTDAERGKELWARHCVSCHGPENHGDGPATAALVVPVPDLAGQVKPDKPTIDVVLNGKGPMPGFAASFEADDARAVLQHMSTVHVAPAEPAPAAPKPADEAGDVGDAQGPG
jgi:mono/diheme cytochrome c family protein